MYLDEILKKLVGRRYTFTSGGDSSSFLITQVTEDIGYYHLKTKDGDSKNISFDDIEKFINGEKVTYISPSCGKWSLQLNEEKDECSSLLERAKKEIFGKYISCEQYDDVLWFGKIISVEYVNSSNHYLILYARKDESPILGFSFSADELESLLDYNELHLASDINYYIYNDYEEFKKDFYGNRQFYSIRDSIDVWKQRWWELFLKASELILDNSQSWQSIIELTNEGIKSAANGLKDFLKIVDEED